MAEVKCEKIYYSIFYGLGVFPCFAMPAQKMGQFQSASHASVPSRDWDGRWWIMVSVVVVPEIFQHSYRDRKPSNNVIYILY